MLNPRTRVIHAVEDYGDEPNICTTTCGLKVRTVKGFNDPIELKGKFLEYGHAWIVTCKRCLKG